MVRSIRVCFNESLLFFRLDSSYHDEANLLRISIMEELLAPFNLFPLVEQWQVECIYSTKIAQDFVEFDMDLHFL